MTDREFGQAVMERAGVGPKYSWCLGTGLSPHVCGSCGSVDPNPLPHGLAKAWGTCSKKPIYPDPLSAQGFDALWNGLEALGWCVTMHPAKGGQTRANVWMSRRSCTCDNIRDHHNRKAALLEAAAAALGMARACIEGRANG